MKPKNFKEATKVLQKPGDMTNEECSSLSVWNDGKQCISCWKPSIKERLSILLFGNVWLSVRSGNTQPPVWIDGSKTVFNQPSIKEKVLSIFTKDKRLHTLAGFIISLVFGVWFPWIGIGLGVVAGAVKEYWDSRGHGCVELLDFVFTVIGALIAFALTFFLLSPFIHSLVKL